MEEKPINGGGAQVRCSRDPLVSSHAPMPSDVSMRGCAATILAGLLVAAAACGGPSKSLAPSTPVVASVAVTGVAPALGNSAQFSASASFSDGSVRLVTSEALWASTAPSVATVSGGLVTAVASGNAVITATFQQVGGSAPIAVAPIAGAALTSFMRDYIEALFLGTGPLTPTDGVRGCPRGFGSWLGFPPGTSVQMLISGTVPQVSANAMIDAAAAVPAASAGTLSVSIGTTAESDPLPATNQVTATMHADPLSLGCSFPQGCTRFNFAPGTPLVLSARAILVTGQFPGAYVHDAVGHGVMGLCHVDGNLIGGAHLSLMSYGPGVFSNQLPNRLSDYDVAATKAVFSSGLARGATRIDFQQAGLVNVGNATSAGAGGALPLGTDSQIASPRVR